MPSPSKRSTGTRQQTRATVLLSEPEVEAVLAQLPETSRHGAQPRAFFTIMWETALRKATLERLRAPDDYQVGRTELIIRPEIDKTRFGRPLPLSERARRILDSVCPTSGLIFGAHDLRHSLRKAARNAGVEEERAAKLSNHDIRHSRATLLGANTKDLSALAYLLGHRHVSTTSIYVAPLKNAASALLDELDDRPAHTHLRAIRGGKVAVR